MPISCDGAWYLLALPTLPQHVALLLELGRMSRKQIAAPVGVAHHDFYRGNTRSCAQDLSARRTKDGGIFLGA